MFIDSVRIDPGNAFRLVVKVSKFVADGEYGLVEMADQEHEIWFDRTVDYTLSKFYDAMATKIIWGPSQTLSVWAVDSDSDSEWKIRRDKHFEELIKDRWADRTVVLVVDVVSKNGQGSGTAGSVRSASGVTTAEASGVHANAGGSGIDANSGAPENAEGCGDTSSSPPLLSLLCLMIYQWM